MSLDTTTITSAGVVLKQQSAPSDEASGTTQIYATGNNLFYKPNGADAVQVGSSSGATLSNDANNRVTTADGSGGINGEANLTFDGSTLTVTGDAVVTDDLTLNSDSAVLNMGAGNDVTFTHDGTTGLTIAATPISIDATGELHLNSTTGDIKFQDGGTDQLALDMDGTSGEVIMKLMVDSDDFVFKQYDGTEVLRVEDNGDFDIAGGAGSTGVTITSAGVLTADGRIIVDDATEATTTTDGSLQTDGGLSVAKSAVIGDDLDLLSDNAILSIGSTSKFSMADVGANNCVMAGANHRLAFGNAGEYISGDGTDMKIVSSNDIDVTGDVNVTGEGTFTKLCTLASAEGVTTIGSSTAAVFTAAGILQVNNTTDATSTTDGSLQTDGGLSVAKDVIAGNDVKLLSDSAVLSLGAGGDATFTHDGTTGLTIAATPISIDSTGELHLNSTTGDIKLQDGGTDQITFDLDGTAGEVIMKPAVDSDDLVIQQYDGTEVIRVEDDGTLGLVGNKLNIKNNSSDVEFKPLTDAKDLVFKQYDGTEVMRINDDTSVTMGTSGGGVDFIAYGATANANLAWDHDDTSYSTAGGTLKFGSFSGGKNHGVASRFYGDTNNTHMLWAPKLSFPGISQATLRGVTSPGGLLELKGGRTIINTGSLCTTMSGAAKADDVFMPYTTSWDMEMAASGGFAVLASSSWSSGNGFAYPSGFGLFKGDGTYFEESAWSMELGHANFGLGWNDDNQLTHKLRIAHSSSWQPGAAEYDAMTTGSYIIHLESKDQSNSQVPVGGIVISSSVAPTNGVLLQIGNSSHGAAKAKEWQTFSSRELKHDIEEMHGALDMVNRMKARSFKWNHGGGHDIGFIADEMQEVVPQVCGINPKTGVANAIDYGRLTSVLVGAVKEQQEQINELKDVIVKLSNGNIVNAKMGTVSVDSSDEE